MRRRVKSFTMPLLAVMLLAAASNRYSTRVDLGTLGGPFAAATGINNRGQVVGWADRADNTSHAFLWWKGRMEALGTLGGSYSVANAINEKGQAVGLAETPDLKRIACLWESGRGRALDPVPQQLSEAFAINNSGDVAGFYYTGEVLRACVWRHGVRIDLGLPQPASSIAYGINDTGWVTGWSFPQNSRDQCGFLWGNGSWTTVGKCREISGAGAINNRGDFLASGYEAAVYGAGTAVSYLYSVSGAAPVKLGLSPRAISQRGQIVGECDNLAARSPTPRHACISEDGEVFHFGADNTVASAINDSGDIAGMIWLRVGARALLWR